MRSAFNKNLKKCFFWCFLFFAPLFCCFSAGAMRLSHFFPAFNTDIEKVFVQNKWPYEIPVFSNENDAHIGGIKTGEVVEIRYVDLDSQKAFLRDRDVYIPTIFFAVQDKKERNYDTRLKKAAVRVYERVDWRAIFVSGVGSNGNNLKEVFVIDAKGEDQSDQAQDRSSDVGVQILGATKEFAVVRLSCDIHESASDDALYFVYWSEISPKTFSGVDISGWQSRVKDGKRINIGKLVSNDLDFVFLKVGGVTGEKKEPFVDSTFEYAYNQLSLVPDDGQRPFLGVYFVSRFENEEQVHEQANFLMNHLKGKDIRYPVMLDLEEAFEGDDLFKNLSESGKLFYLVARFLSILREEGGYHVGVYSNWSFLKEYLRVVGKDKSGRSTLGCCYIWLGWYLRMGDRVELYDCSDDCDMWQYTDRGSGAQFGALSKNIDLDVSYWNFEWITRFCKK
ncbi:MAG: hypothetical protein LBH37_00750 [Oscillospiraceae bacterium]|jgi:GH25 family lysozyme M1 (1,4-beta-N-acetylmuramidase)|nr:hypothetical protein [Oscillospiraceae bacterium]